MHERSPQGPTDNTHIPAQAAEQSIADSLNAVIADIFGVPGKATGDAKYDFQRHGMNLRIRATPSAVFAYASNQPPVGSGNGKLWLEQDAVFYEPDCIVERHALKQGDSHLVDGRGRPIFILEISGLLKGDDEADWEAANDNSEEFVDLIEAAPDSIYAPKEAAPPPPKVGRNQMMTAALDLATQRNWEVFPADISFDEKTGKFRKKSFKSAEYSNGAAWGKTRDPDQIRKDFNRWLKANIGIVTGAESGIFVTETDTKKGHNVDGDASLQALEQEYGPLPGTLMAISPSGSKHRYYKHPGQGIKIKNSASELGPGIDVRGDGGMVIAPPSVRGDGQYRWLNNNEIAEAPAWLIDLATATAKSNGKGASAGKYADIKIAEEFKHLNPKDWLADGIEDSPPLLFDPIKVECGWLREAFETGGKDFNNPQWSLTTLAAVFLENGHELAHAFGKRHPGYTIESTDKKWDEKVHAHKNGVGWPSCKAIKGAGSKHCKSCPHFDDGNEKQSPLHLALTAKGVTAKGVTRADFCAYLPDHSYIFTPTGAFWSKEGVNACLPPTLMIGMDGEPVVFMRGENTGKPKFVAATTLLNKNQPIHHLAWVPGHPMLIKNQLVIDGEWAERNGVTTFNLYRPPTLKHGDPSKAGPWLELVHKVYPQDAGRLIAKLAHRVQRPGEKINHAVLMGGAPGIGKDTILEPVRRAIGSWNWRETSPPQMLGRFNGFLQSVVMRINEVRDLGEFNRYQFYEHTKPFFAAPPNTLRVDEKDIPEHEVMNVLLAILTANRTDGIYLPSDDRRHDVMWSRLTKADFREEYWVEMWEWYNEGGDGHVAAYLATLDISAFNPKAPPPQTEAFWTIVNANRAPEEGELQDLLDQLGNPDAIVIDQIIKAASGTKNLDIKDWLKDRKNRRSIPHRFEAVGYTPIHNEAARSGLWVIGGIRQVVYAKKDLLPRDRLAAVAVLKRKADEEATTAASHKADGKGQSTAPLGTLPQETDLDRDVVDLLKRPKK